MMDKNLTILIPLYNKVDFVDRCVKSISEQTYLPQTKIIVLEDCSTDGSLQKLYQCSAKYNVPMQIYSTDSNIGFSKSMRILYRMIDTEFWTWLGVDDYYYTQDRLERAVKFLEQHPDYSMHVCNYVEETIDHKMNLAIPAEVKNFSADSYENMLRLQFGAMTCRNFWNDELLDYVENLAGNARYHFTDCDGFVNFITPYYGKIYFDNFPGNVFQLDTGLWGSLSNFETDILFSKFYLDLINFEQDFFHQTKSFKFFLEMAYNCYSSASKNLHHLIKNLKAVNFRTSNYVLESLYGEVIEDHSVTALIPVLLQLNQQFLDLGCEIVTLNEDGTNSGGS